MTPERIARIVGTFGMIYVAVVLVVTVVARLVRSALAVTSDAGIGSRWDGQGQFGDAIALALAVVMIVCAIEINRAP